MNSDDVIRSLVADLAPVRRLPSSESRALSWAAFAVACAAVGAFAHGARADLAAKLQDAEFVREGATMLAVAALAVHAAFRFSVPGREPRLVARALPIAALLAWAALVASRHGAAGAEPLRWAGARCVATMSELALAPLVVFVLMLRGAAPFELGWAGLYAALGASAVAMSGTQIVCTKDDALHVLVWHFAPVAAAALLGIPLGRRLLERASRSAVNRAPAGASAAPP